MADCSPCADYLDSRLDAALASAESAAATTWSNTAPLRALLSSYPGQWVVTPAGDLPCLAEIVNRIHNLGGGFSRWDYVAGSGEDDALTLPVDLDTGALARVWRNGVPLAPTRDYTVTDTALALAHDLNPGDWITVATYGG